MWAALGTSVDFIHALSMAVWVVGLPLLGIRRWPSLTKVYSVYAIVFVVASQASMWALGECFLTTLSRACWSRVSSATAGAANEWFTVRLAYAVFGMAPSHRAISIVSELLIVATALGVLISRFARPRPEARHGRLHAHPRSY
jgi:hypothetical protein